MNKKLKYLFTIVFVFGIFSYFLISAGTAGMTLIRRVMPKQKASVRTNAASSEETAVSSSGSVSAVISKLQGNIEKMITSSNPVYYPIVFAKKTFDKTIYQYNLTTSQNGTANDYSDTKDVVVRHSGGGLAFLVDDYDITPHIDAFVEFAVSMKEQGRNVLLFIPPGKHDDLDMMYSDIFHDYQEDKKNQIISACEASGISYYLFDEYAKQNGLSENDLFFMTDHHWLPQWGIKSCLIISEWLNTNGYHIDTSVYDLNSYSISECDNPFLGSLGKKVTEAYIDDETMKIIIPAYNSDITVYAGRNKKPVRGTIAETLLYYSFLSDKNKYEQFQYHFYGGNDQAQVLIHNELLNDSKRILLIKNSFANCAFPFMNSMAEFVDVIDLRYYEESLQDHIAETNPDTVIVFYGVTTFTNFAGQYDLAFDFH